MTAAAGIVLAGGRSSRMGTAKAALEWHGSTLLRRTTAILARVVDGPLLVIRAPGQGLPELAAGVEVVDDPREGLGPVQGIAAGLTAAEGRAGRAFICSTDLPFLHPAFVRVVLGASADTDVALPVARGFPQPLAAAYSTTLAQAARELVAQGRLRPAFLFDGRPVRRLTDTDLLDDPELAKLDPDLDSLLNVNEPADYQAARSRPAPEVTVELFGTLAAGQRGPRLVRAATLAEAGSQAGLDLGGGHIVAALNGDRIYKDDQLPLVAGDTVSFLTADAGG